MITPEQLQESFKRRLKYTAYNETVDRAHHVCFHVDGHERLIGGKKLLNPYYVKLITDRRPRESEKVRDYRQTIYKNITKSTIKKVLNTLVKIYKAPDWKISYDRTPTPSGIPKAERLNEYAEKNYPGFGSLKNWAATFMTKQIIKDANAVVVVMPVDLELPDNEYLKPVANIIPSEKVFRFKENDHLLYEAEEKTTYMVDGRPIQGDVYYLFQDGMFSKLLQIDSDRNFRKVDIRPYPVIPFFRIGGEITDVVEGSIIYESFISGMLPYLDEAAREYSDLQASVVQHLYPLMWFMAGQDCKKCNGTGLVAREGKNVACAKCKGEGTMPRSPYTDITVKQKAFDEGTPVTPPAGEVAKSTAITELQSERVDNHLYNALSSLNMEFLSRVDASQSGIAKEFDREELNTYIGGIARHIVENVLKPVYKIVAAWRYSGVFEKFEELIPSIAVPEKFDIVTDRMLIAELEKGKEAQIDPVIRSEVEIDYAEKRFRTDEKSRQLIITSKRHNPFPGLTQGEIDEKVLSGSVSKIDAIMSAYIVSFVTQASIEDPEFLTSGFAEQRAKLIEMARQKLSEIGEG